MTMQRLLIANRGEIAIRIARAAAELGIATVAVYSEDDARSLHVRRADSAVALAGSGAAAYLDIEQIVAVALAANCDAVHPGYGFLSENALFAQRCAEAGITFVGPPPALLELFGDKAKSRALAERHGVPVVPGTRGATSLDEAREFLRSLGLQRAVMIKAIAGGGGRGMRAVHRAEELDEAYARCRSEARATFGNDTVYLEQLVTGARHIEVQIIGDGSGRVSHLGERECSLQRRNQKLVEIAPSPSLEVAVRDRVIAAAVRLAQSVDYRGLGTFEFLIGTDEGAFAYIETNPRLQVEHTVTEMVTGIDLVTTQLQLAAGRTLTELGLEQPNVPRPAGYAVQVRINMESMAADGSARPTGGTLAVFDPPGGPGVRVDTFGYAGYKSSPNFDSLLAKLIVHSTSQHYAEAVAKTYRALCEFRIEGIVTNQPFLQNLLRDPDVIANRVYTTWVEEHVAQWSVAGAAHPRHFFEHGHANSVPGTAASAAASAAAASAGWPGSIAAADDGTVAVIVPMQGRVVAIDVHAGDTVRAGQQIGVLEAMKMEHAVSAPVGGVIARLAVSGGETVYEGQAFAYLEPVDSHASAAEQQVAVDLDLIRPDLAEVIERHALGRDARRPQAVARRRKTGQRTARENLGDLLDPDSLIEYGAMAIAAQRSRRTVEDLIANTPADGLVAGIGTVNGRWFDATRARCMALVYDYTVLAGTQGALNHKKKDRMIQLAEKWRLPIALFAEGGGGRPGDTDIPGVGGLDCYAFYGFARLSGLVPLVGVVSGRCFAGNAALLGCCDVIIATANASIGMGGPAMIEGGGLGVVAPDDVGPVDMQSPNGVIDILVDDEQQAVAAAKQYLSYFQGRIADYECVDQRTLRHLIPENRARAYEIRTVIEALADTGWVLELRRPFGVGIVTALIRIEGRPLGLIANNPRHLGGAIDSAAADKAARFMQLCDAFDLPILSLCDTPGFMVGPDSERTASVRHVSRMFVTAANLTVPFFSIVLRKGYGLGAQGMTAGSFHAPFFNVAWPSGEFGPMGLEGAVRLGYRKELEAVSDPHERAALFDKMVAASYERGKALNMASYLEIDDVIDPLDSRRWVVRGLDSVPAPAARNGKKRPNIDTW